MIVCVYAQDSRVPIRCKIHRYYIHIFEIYYMNYIWTGYSILYVSYIPRRSGDITSTKYLFSYFFYLE